MNRHIWQRNFYERDEIKWPCPTCFTGQLALQKDSLYKLETRESRDDFQNPNWEPQWTEGRFSCLLTCRGCSEVIAVAGRYTLEEWGDPEISPEWRECFEPRFFMEAPNIIHIPEKLPAEIKKELEKSFQLYWVDLGSCANRIRSSVEMMLTHIGIKRYSITNKNRRVGLTLHARIEDFKKKKPLLADSLFAIKWIGNAGSHSSGLESGDVLDGYEILEHVLGELFDQKSKRLEKMAREINRAKKPRSVGMGFRH